MKSCTFGEVKKRNKVNKEEERNTKFVLSQSFLAPNPLCSNSMVQPLDPDAMGTLSPHVTYSVMCQLGNIANPLKSGKTEEWTVWIQEGQG